MPRGAARPRHKVSAFLAACILDPRSLGRSTLKLRHLPQCELDHSRGRQRDYYHSAQSGSELPSNQTRNWLALQTQRRTAMTHNNVEGLREELTEQQMEKASGGLNPQPLPPDKLPPITVIAVRKVGGDTPVEY